MSYDVVDTEETTLEVIPVSAVESITRGEVDIQISTAKRYPRSIHKAIERSIKLATLNEDIAASCFYALPRDKKIIEGPSIRLAEIIMSAWGNLRVSARIIDIGDTFITAQAQAYDLETNNAISIEVRRRITNKWGKRYNDDMIVMTGNAGMSIAMRNAVFYLVPRSYIDPVYQAARNFAIGDAKTLAARRDKAIGIFQKMGVSLEQVLKTLGRDWIDDIVLEDIAVLTGIYTAIKDGETTIDTAFPPIVAVAKPSFLTDIGEPKNPEKTAPTSEPDFIDPKDPLGVTEKETKKK